MAIVQNPLIHRASGSVGNSTFSKWKKKNTLRSKSIVPYPAPTSLQALARVRFKNCTEFYKPLLPFSRFLFASSKSKFSALNSFVKTNLSLFADDSSVIAAGNVAALVFSTGTIESYFQNAIVPISYLRYYVTGSFLFDYSINHLQVAMLAICVDMLEKDILVFSSPVGTYNNVEINIPASRVGHVFVVFVCSLDYSKSKSSNSANVGSFTAS